MNPAQPGPDSTSGHDGDHVSETRAAHRAEELRLERARRRKLAVTGLAVVALAAGAIVGVSWLTGRDDDSPRTVADQRVSQCTTRTPVTVWAPAAAQAAVDEVATQYETTAEAPCVDYVVSAHESAETVEAVGTGGEDAPDAWIADSPRWVDRVQTAGGDRITPALPFAVSPLVVAMDPERAQQLEAPPQWTQLLDAATGFRLSEPRSTTAGMLALAALGPALGGPEGRATIQRLAKSTGSSTTELFQAHEADRKQASAFPASEAELIAHNLAVPTAPMTLVAPVEATPPFEYALVTVTEDADGAAAVNALRSQLHGSAAAPVLAKHGLRATVDPARVPVALTGPSVGTPEIGASPTTRQVSAGADLWQAAVVPFRLLVAFDVSGSMDNAVGSSTRIAITQGAASIALQALPRETEIGLWAFSVGIGPGGADYRELAPLASLEDDAHRRRGAAAIASLPGMVRGGTGLYDTIWAAYQRLQRDHDPERVNAVVLLTDGYNEDPEGLTLAELKARISSVADPRRPVAVTTIGIGDDVDAKSLTEISRMTNSDYYPAPRPQDIGPVLTRALFDHECKDGVCV